MATEKIKRPLIAHFLDTTEKKGEYSAAKWARIGKKTIRFSPISITLMHGCQQ